MNSKISRGCLFAVLHKNSLIHQEIKTDLTDINIRTNFKGFQHPSISTPAAVEQQKIAVVICLLFCVKTLLSIKLNQAREGDPKNIDIKISSIKEKYCFYFVLLDHRSCFSRNEFMLKFKRSFKPGI